MSLALVTNGKQLTGSLQAISSKSELHRMLICAAFSAQPSAVLCTPILSKDIEATISCLVALGAKIEKEEGKIKIIRPITHVVSDKSITLDCHESGSTARFFLPYASMFRKNAMLIGQGKLPERPMMDLCQCLEEHGALFSDYYLPITIRKCSKKTGSFSISGNISSQYLTGLLLALPFIDGQIELSTQLHSSGYVDITTDVMQRFGVNVKEENGVYTASGTYRTKDENVMAFGDWSNAAFFLCGAALSGQVTLSGIDIKSKQPDRAVLDTLRLFGADVKVENHIITVSRKECLPFKLDAENIPDLVPILAVLAAGAVGKTTISNITRLRLKESDRVDAVCKLICGLGGTAEADENNLYILGTGKLKGGCVDSFNDHRIAMAASIASVLCESPVEIHDCMAVTKSYPHFYEDFNKLIKTDIKICP